MPISGHGWEFHVQRVGLHKKGDWIRTYGTYAVYRNGAAVANLSGWVCESPPPGDKILDSGHRLVQGRYRLATQEGPAYRTVSYIKVDVTELSSPRPGILLATQDTAPRNGIIIHPAHPGPKGLFLSSVGCLNPTSALAPDQDMDWQDSRQRVIDLIQSLTDFHGAALPDADDVVIANAWAVLDGEPTNLIADDLVG